MQYLIFALFIGMIYFTFQGHLEVKIKMATNNNVVKNIFTPATTMNVCVMKW